MTRKYQRAPVGSLHTPVKYKYDYDNAVPLEWQESGLEKLDFEGKRDERQAAWGSCWRSLTFPKRLATSRAHNPVLASTRRYEDRHIPSACSKLGTHKCSPSGYETVCSAKLPSLSRSIMDQRNVRVRYSARRFQRQTLEDDAPGNEFLQLI